MRDRVFCKKFSYCSERLSYDKHASITLESDSIPKIDNIVVFAFTCLFEKSQVKGDVIKELWI